MYNYVRTNILFLFFSYLAAVLNTSQPGGTTALKFSCEFFFSVNCSHHTIFSMRYLFYYSPEETMKFNFKL